MYERTYYNNVVLQFDTQISFDVFPMNPFVVYLCHRSHELEKVETNLIVRAGGGITIYHLLDIYLINNIRYFLEPNCQHIQVLRKGIVAVANA